MLSIQNNLSAGTQNVTGTYVIIMLVYRRMLTMRYNLEVHNVIKYMRKHRATDVTNYITCKSAFV